MDQDRDIDSRLQAAATHWQVEFESYREDYAKLLNNAVTHHDLDSNAVAKVMAFETIAAAARKSRMTMIKLHSSQDLIDKLDWALE